MEDRPPVGDVNMLIEACQGSAKYSGAVKRHKVEETITFFEADMVGV